MKKKVGFYFLFLIILCAIFYYVIIAYTGGVNAGSVFVLGLMWAPGFSALCSKLIVDHSIRGLGLRIRGWKYIGFAYILPLVACLIVYGLCWICKIGTFSPMPIQTILLLSLVGIFMSMFSAIGEEIGWRGFLLTELRKEMDFTKVCIVIGLVWFFYHVPLIIFSNYNNGNIPVSVICFFFSVLGITVIANYFCIKAGSFWPAVMLHASHNLFVQNIFDKMTVNKKYTQFLTSEFGVGLAVCYVFIAVILYKKMKQDN